MLTPMPIGPHSLDEYLHGLAFAPDRFQVEALDAISGNRSVVVTAPTGAGKTVIAEGAIVDALAHEQRAFYTTPIKALSNQKFSDLVAMFGKNQVGLLTGDNVVNGDAPIVVMTTEVLRNMIYEDSSALDRLRSVILDEVHYLADRERGSVWEEIIIHLPRTINLVALSATIANPDEFTDWIRLRRGATDLVVEETRPVPLETMFAWKDRHRGGSVSMLPMFGRNGRPNATISKVLQSKGGRGRRINTPRRTEVVQMLAEDNLLPAIFFVFSRAGCDQTARDLAHSGLDLTTADSRREIDRIIAERTSHIPEHDLVALGFDKWCDTLRHGVAAHHAGLIPAFKETVEDLFIAGLVRCVVATETLSVGINMPARTVVLDSLSKFTGEGHELLQPSDFTQLTGRAGRRGIDVEGTAVVLYSRYVPFERATGIAGRGANVLRSSFAPSYNMTVNLIARYDRNRAIELLEASFANHAVESRRDRLRENLEDRKSDLATFEQAAQCERGDVTSVDPSARPSRTVDRHLLQPGAVLELAGGKYVLGARSWGGGRPRLVLIDQQARRSTIVANDLPTDAVVVGELSLPTPILASNPDYRREVVSALESFIPDDEPRPVHNTPDDDGVLGCPDLDTHLQWLARADRVRRDIALLERRLSRRADLDIVADFRRHRRVLDKLGYVDGWEILEPGESLRRVYNQRDILLAETIRAGLFDSLDTSAFAAAATVFTYETRGADVPPYPTADFAEGFLDGVESIRERIAAVEDEAGVDPQEGVDPGFIDPMYAWASGHDIADIFEDESNAGDFVRSTRQLVDLLRQLRDGFPELASHAAKAIAAIDRGIVQLGGIN